MKHSTVFELIFVLSFSSVLSEFETSFSVKIEDDVPLESCSKTLSQMEVRKHFESFNAS